MSKKCKVPLQVLELVGGRRLMDLGKSDFDGRLPEWLRGEAERRPLLLPVDRERGFKI
jgi:hypothetical protein